MAEEKKTIAVSPKVHQQAKINAAIKGKQLKEYIGELVMKDTKKQSTPQEK